MEQTLVWPVKKKSACRSANSAHAELGADTSFSFSRGGVWLCIGTASFQQMAAGVCYDVWEGTVRVRHTFLLH